MTEGSETGDLKGLLESVFDDPFIIAQRSAGRWQFNITDGDYAGYVVVIEGNELTGDGQAPTHGHIAAIIVREGDTVVASRSGLNLSTDVFDDVFDSGDDEPDAPDDEPDDGTGGDGTGGDEPDEPATPTLNLDKLRDLFKSHFEVTERTDGEWTYVITDGRFEGYSIVVSGDGFTGDGYVPDEGRITGIAVLNGDDQVIGERSGVSLPIDVLRNKFQHDHGEDLSGGSGDDEIHGGRGDDHFEGGHGHDELHGGGGDDDINGGDGDDDLSGNRGDDDLDGQGGNDTVSGGGGGDDLHGRSGDDEMRGGGGDDKLNGGGGADDLCGNGGSDAIKGGGGDDTLTGGAGQDRLIGGGGADHFVFLLAADSAVGDGRDIIVDFKPGVDVIDLSAIDADGQATEGNGAFAFIGDAAFGGVAGELRIAAATHSKHGVTIIAGDTDGDGTADFEIALAGHKTLTAADFVL